MRLLFTLFLILSAGVAPAAADCAAEIRSLFEGGAWDPFARENRRETTVVQRSDGTVQPSSDVLWDGPIKSINCTPNGCFMAIGFAAWSGSSFEGPWTRSTDIGTGDPEAFVRGTNTRLAESVREPECLGETDLDGQRMVHYRFLSKPEPNEHGSWWGGRYTIWVDPALNRLMRIELSEGIASWAPEPSKDVQVTTIVYDDAISINTPD